MCFWRARKRGACPNVKHPDGSDLTPHDAGNEHLRVGAAALSPLHCLDPTHERWRRDPARHEVSARMNALDTLPHVHPTALVAEQAKRQRCHPRCRDHLTKRSQTPTGIGARRKRSRHLGPQQCSPRWFRRPKFVVGLKIRKRAIHAGDNKLLSKISIFYRTNHNKLARASLTY